MVRQREFLRILSGLGAFVLVAGIAAQVLLSGRIYALQITNRTLTLQTGTTPSDVNGDGISDGGSMPGGTANDLFTFTVPSATSVNTLTFTYCTTAAAVPGGIQCDIPTGMDASNAALGNDSGTGWTITAKTQNTVTVSGTATSLAGSKTFRIDNVKNPTATNTTFFVRIATVDSTGPTTVDTGTVAASTATPIILQGTMPESLVFCTGHTVNINASGVPDCTTATGGTVSFNQLFDPNTTSWAYSQMAASTNATFGYAITVNGPTMTSGSNTINPIGATADISRPGTRQFGLNLIDDFAPVAPTVTDPTIGNGSPDPITYFNGDGAGTGAALHPVSDGSNYNGIAATGFDGTGNAGHIPTYSFAAGSNNTVATSNFSGTGAGPSDTQRYTATYIVNVSGNLPAGSYATTLTYICTPTF